MLGQHFLIDGNIREKILDAAEIRDGECIVEIGPGTGYLTAGLLGRGARVIAIEIDRRLVEGLARAVIPNLTLVCADALRYPYRNLSTPYKVVANLPYNISTPLLFLLIEAGPKMVLMLQKEVALRLSAHVGDANYGALSLVAQFYTDVRILCSVSRNCFRPRPKVDSAVVVFDPPRHPRQRVRHPAYFLKLVKGAFAHRRKQMLNSLSDAGFPRRNMEEAMHRMGLSSTVRGETLSLASFAELSNILSDIHADPLDEHP